MDIQQLKHDYQRDGVVRLRKLLTPDEVAQVRQAVDRFIREKAPTVPPGDVVYEADGKSIRNLFHLDKTDPWFERFAHQPRFMEMVRPLVNGEPEVWGVETFSKPAKVGSVVPYHQDNAYFCQTPPDILSLWIAIDPATEENGAVIYLKGTHHELRPHVPSGVKGNSYSLADPAAVEQDHEAFMGTLEPGDALLHHGQVVHRSDPNRSEKPRLALVTVYRGKHTQTDQAKQAEYRKAMEAAFAQ